MCGRRPQRNDAENAERQGAPDPRKAKEKAHNALLHLHLSFLARIVRKTQSRACTPALTAQSGQCVDRVVVVAPAIDSLRAWKLESLEAYVSLDQYTVCLS